MTIEEEELAFEGLIDEDEAPDTRYVITSWANVKKTSNSQSQASSSKQAPIDSMPDFGDLSFELMASSEEEDMASKTSSRLHNKLTEFSSTSEILEKIISMSAWDILLLTPVLCVGEEGTDHWPEGDVGDVNEVGEEGREFAAELQPDSFLSNSTKLSRKTLMMSRTSLRNAFSLIINSLTTSS